MSEALALELHDQLRELRAIEALLALQCRRIDRALAQIVPLAPAAGPAAEPAAAPPAAALPPAALPPTPGRKRRTIDRDQLRALHAAGLSDKQMAERLGFSHFSTRNLRHELGLAPNSGKAAAPAPVTRAALVPAAAAPAPATPAAVAIFSASVLVQFLRERGTEVVEVEPGRLWKVNGRTVLDRQQLLALANSKRERLGKPPFEF